MDTRRSYLAIMASAIAIGVGLIGCSPREVVLECPDHNFTIPGDTLTVVPLAGEITNIPEFHDCQRLLVPGHPDSYGPLAGIWVSEALDSLPDMLNGLNPRFPRVPVGPAGMVAPGGLPAVGVIAPAPQDSAIGLAFAEIYSWDGPYPQLGIEQKWNCLYLYPKTGAPGYGAVMVPVGDNAYSCRTPMMLGSLDGARLTVAFDTAGLTTGDAPPVGRWDLDSASKVQFIGIACGNRWCNVYNDSFPARSPKYAIEASKPDTERRVFAVKGWYDQQYLGVKNAAAPAAMGGLAPAHFMGTAIPDPGLDTLDKETDFETWRPVAWVALGEASPDYQHDFNFFPGSLPRGGAAQGLTSVTMCKAGTCKPPEGMSFPSCTQFPLFWGYAVVTGPNHQTRIKCVSRHDHSGLSRHFPGTARWQWLKHDETLWVRCAAGCCTVN